MASGVAVAENIDPANDGSKYAWAENLGWINLRPQGAGGPGVQVTDSGLTGWAWSENAGWISLSCQNTSSCGTNAYGVTNDGTGTLAGYAWSESKGWINFAPTGAGVVINGCTGVFSGRAWSENAGWITFSSTGPNPYQVATSWRRTCDDNNACTTDTCDPASGCVHTNNTNACNDGNACTTGDTCRDGVCSGGTTPPSEFIVNGDFETGTGAIDCAPNPFERPPWTGTGSAIQYGACFWTPSVVVSIGYPGGNSPGTISQSFAATLGPGTLSYEHGSDAATWCSYTVTFDPSNSVVAVSVQLDAAMVAAPTIAVPAGTTSVTFGNPNCTGGNNNLLNFDNVSVQAWVETFLNCDDANACTDDSCNPASGCVHANNTAACDDGNACTTADVCNGGACSGTAITAPPETQILNPPDKSTYNWNAAAFATQYDALRGSLGAFPVGPGGDDEVCFDNLSGPTLSDTTVPATGTGFWYLSRGENACGIGTYGTQGNHGAPGAPRTTTTCP